MQAIEFETVAHNGAIAIPAQYKNFFGKAVKVIVLEQENEQPNSQNMAAKAKSRAFFEKIRLDLSQHPFNREEANER